MDQPGDDDRTIIRPRPSAGGSATLGHILPTGTHLLDYEITGLIGEGGFGIVYLAWDHSLQRQVAVKEYMPASMASRAAGSSAIVVKSERHLDTFKAGLKSFVNEARLLARFDHRALVKVYRFWEENGTAYMVMPFYEGPTLKSALAELGHPPDERELRAWLDPLIDALSVMHAAQCFHRDIAPDNILLTPGGPLLLDFGAARRVIGDMTHALTVVLKPGYAPIEQYGDVATMTQGPWTDIYALACVVYYAITGRTPTSSVERLMDDRLEPLAKMAAGRYGDAFLRAIDGALAVRPQDRPQNVTAFRAVLDADRPSGFGTDSAAAPFATSASMPFPTTQQNVYSTVPGTLTPVLATQLQARAPDMPPPEPTHALAPPPSPATVAPAAEPTGAPQVQPTLAPPTGEAIAPATRPSRRGLALLGGGAVVLALAAATAWWSQTAPGEGTALRPVEPAASAVAAPPPASAVAPVAPASTAATSTAPPTVTADREPAASAAAAAPAATTTTPPMPPPTTATTATPTQSASASPNVPSVAAEAPPAHAAEPARTPARAAVEPAPSAPARPRRPPPTRVEPPARSEPPAPRRSGGARCSDILQKASLEPLTAEEAAYLRRECR